MPDGRVVISSEGSLTPAEVLRRSFPTSFRGFDQPEVKRFLERVSDELTAGAERERELRAALEEAKRLASHPKLDEATLTAALGEETASVLRSAREAANEIRSKAEATVARAVRDA